MNCDSSDINDGMQNKIQILFRTSGGDHIASGRYSIETKGIVAFIEKYLLDTFDRYNIGEESVRLRVNKENLDWFALRCIFHTGYNGDIQDYHKTLLREETVPLAGCNVPVRTKWPTSQPVLDCNGKLVKYVYWD